MNDGTFVSEGKERLSLDRVNALSDGVMAVVITILVLGIDIPTEHSFTEAGLMSFFIKLEPSLIAYGTSFVMVGIYWIQNHVMFSFLRYVNRRLILLNLLFLFPVTLLPFVAKVKALYRYDALVVVIFAGAHILCGLILLAMWAYIVSHPELLVKPVTPQVTRSMALRILITPAVSLVAMGAAFVNIDIGTYIFLIIPFFYLSNHVVDSYLYKNIPIDDKSP